MSFGNTFQGKPGCQHLQQRTRLHLAQNNAGQNHPQLPGKRTTDAEFHQSSCSKHQPHLLVVFEGIEELFPATKALFPPSPSFVPGDDPAGAPPGAGRFERNTPVASQVSHFVMLPIASEQCQGLLSSTSRVASATGQSSKQSSLVPARTRPCHCPEPLARAEHRWQCGAELCSWGLLVLSGSQQ